MKRNILFSVLIASLVLMTSCKPAIKSGYVNVPTVTKNALSGVYDMSPTSPTTRLYYEEAGQGEPVILLHGHSVDCRMWDDVFFKLAKRYRVIRYDLRGYGKSGMPEVGFGYLHADDLNNLMEALKIRKAHLAGVSLGGMVLTDFVALYPNRVLSATISSGAITNIPDRSSAPKVAVQLYNDTVFALQRQKVQDNLRKGVINLKTDWKRSMKQISGKRYHSIKKKLFRMIDDWPAWQWTHPEVDPFIGDQADSLLTKQKVHPPILLIIGQHDFDSSKKSMQRMASLCPGARIEQMSNAGHFTVMEYPDDFEKRLEAFINFADKTVIK